jgi:hypothetical protein
MLKYILTAAVLLLFCTAARAYECDGPTCPEECPVGSYYYTNFAGLEFCTFDGIKLPLNARSECGEVAPAPGRLVGWVGYSFPLAGNEGYTCSVGFARAPDARGRGLCFAAAWPQHTGAFAYCDYLVTGCDPVYGCYEGYGWRE